MITLEGQRLLYRLNQKPLAELKLSQAILRFGLEYSVTSQTLPNKSIIIKKLHQHHIDVTPEYLPANWIVSLQSYFKSA